MQPVPAPTNSIPKNKYFNLPIKLKKPPITVSTVHLPKFLTIKANPSRAAVQKLFPSKAI